MIGKQIKTNGQLFQHIITERKLSQLGVCEFMDKSEFADGVKN